MRPNRPRYVFVDPNPHALRSGVTFHVSGFRFEGTYDREPASKYVRMRVRVARVRQVTADVLRGLFDLQAPTRFSRWNWDWEVSGLLTFEATSSHGGEPNCLTATRKALARDLLLVLRDDRLMALLNHAKAQACCQPDLPGLDEE